MSTRLMLLPPLLLLGCATAPRPKWVDDAQLQYDATKYPDDAAVVLYRAEKTALVEDGNNSFTRRERHEVTVVRGEAGFWLAEVKVPWRATEKLLGFHARLVQPDGSRREFDAKDFLSDVSSKGERSANAHFFRFPDVRVGSVLEYWWSIEAERFWGGDEQDTLGEFPVRRYEFELTAAKPLVVETAVFNGASPIEVRENGNGQHQLRFTLLDLPRREKVDFAPHWTFTEPRWAWRVVAYRDRAVTHDWYRDWKDVVERRGAAFLEAKLYDGFAERLDAQGCDALCLAGRARDLIHARTSSAGVRWDRAEPLAAALSSGKASTTERALMMKVLLERAGVQTQLAFGTGSLARQVSPSFPNLEQFDTLFVVLPVQPGVARPVTLDPTCGFCAPGTLTARHRDEQIYVFETKKTVLGANVTEGRWVSAVAEPAPRAERRITHRARVEADGAVADEVAVEAVGLDADVSVEDFKQRPKKLLEHERGAWRRSSPLAEVTNATRGDCVAGRCTWATKARFPSQAWKDDGGWNVHLGFLSAAHQALFDDPERTLDVHFGWDDADLREVVELTAPPGTKLVTWPEPVRVTAGNLRVEVVVERTADGARITRSLGWKLGVGLKAEYPELRAAADAFKRARQVVLTFR